MKCPMCGLSVKATTIPDYHYKGSGLPHVHLDHSVYRYACAKGHSFVEITGMERLHDVIAYQLLKKRTLLTPEEFKFLRKWVGLTAEKLSALLGFKSRITISRYENGRKVINGASDHAMRLLVLRVKEQFINERMNMEIEIHEWLSGITGKSKPAQITINCDTLKNLPFGQSKHLVNG